MNVEYWDTFKGYIYDLYPPIWDLATAFLGKYAGAVLSAYFLSILLLVMIVVRSIRRAKRVRAQLAEVEARKARS